MGCFISFKYEVSDLYLKWSKSTRVVDGQLGTIDGVVKVVQSLSIQFVKIDEAVEIDRS